MLSRRFVAAPDSDPVPGQVPPGSLRHGVADRERPVADSCGSRRRGGPALPADGSWLAAHLRGRSPCQAAGTGGRWRVVLEAVQYQPQRILYVYGPDNVQVRDQRTDRARFWRRARRHGRTGRCRPDHRAGRGGLRGRGGRGAGAAGAARRSAMARAILRPLREAARPAPRAARGEPSAGGAPRAAATSMGPVAEPLASHAEYDMTRCPAQLRASRTAEAAARRSAAEMAERLGEVSLDMRTSVNVVRGFAAYYRQRRPPRLPTLTG